MSRISGTDIFALLNGSRPLWLPAADFREADLRQADLRGADLTGADLTNARLVHARYDASTKWPAGSDPDAARAVKV